MNDHRSDPAADASLDQYARKGRPGHLAGVFGLAGESGAPAPSPLGQRPEGIGGAGSVGAETLDDGSFARGGHWSEAGPPRIEVPGYRVSREISRGGQAVVFEATQASTGRRVALKVLREGPLATPQERARFQREVQILAALSHPDIVQVIDSGTTVQGAMFLAMEYISGRPLDEHLDLYRQQHPERAGDPSELLRLFLRLCEAVNAAHLRGVVHRDLKPSNVRVDENGDPHVLDFGLARTGLVSMTDESQPRAVTCSGQFLGSLPWASPEQAEGMTSKIDARSDVYSLGVILYQVLTGGHFPYEVVGTMRDVLNNILTARPAPPSVVLAARAAREAKLRARRLTASARRAAALNPAIEAVVLKALSKRREDRYQTAGELARDLTNYLAGRPTRAAGLAPRRRRWAAVGAAGVVVCAVVGAAVAARRTIRAAAPTSSPLTSGPSDGPGGPPAPTPAEAFDAAADFSTERNPNGPWSYGDSAGLDGEFHASSACSRKGVLANWSGSDGAQWYASGIAKNISAETFRENDEVVVPPQALVLHPGAGRVYAKVRWTAPADGQYRVSGDFRGLNSKPTTTDVHVQAGSRSLFDGRVEDFEVEHPFSFETSLEKNQVIDFAVGDGGNGIYSDSTGLAARIQRVR